MDSINQDTENITPKEQLMSKLRLDGMEITQ